MWLEVGQVGIQQSAVFEVGLDPAHLPCNIRKAPRIMAFPDQKAYLVFVVEQAAN
jgi:hypothetical protein